MTTARGFSSARKTRRARQYPWLARLLRPGWPFALSLIGILLAIVGAWLYAIGNIATRLAPHIEPVLASFFIVAMGAVARALDQLKTHGSVEPFLKDMQTRQQLYDLIQYTPGTPWEYPVR